MDLDVLIKKTGQGGPKVTRRLREITGPSVMTFTSKPLIDGSLFTPDALIMHGNVGPSSHLEFKVPGLKITLATVLGQPQAEGSCFDGFECADLI